MRYRFALLVLLAVAASAAGCDKTDPVAGTDTEIQLTANPASIDLGNAAEGRSTITATLYGSNGATESGVAVQFSTDTGRMASGGGKIKTDSSGVARDDLIVPASADGETATVTVKSGSKSVDIDVDIGGLNQPPVAKMVLNPLSAHTGENVTFDASGSTDPNGNTTIQRYVWTLTSDNPDATIPSQYLANCVRPVTPQVEICTFGQGLSGFVRSFTNPQILTVQLQVFDDYDVPSKVATSLTPVEIVANFPPTANAGPDISTVLNRGFFVDASRSTDSDGTLKRYDWNMGDGAVYTNRTSPTQSHQYTSYASCGTPSVPAAGCSYTINLIVYDDGTPSAPGYSCVLNLCTGYLTDLDDVKATVN